LNSAIFPSAAQSLATLRTLVRGRSEKMRLLAHLPATGIGSLLSRRGLLIAGQRPSRARARRWHGASALAASAWARARGGGEWIRPARNRLISGVDACGEPPTTCGGRRPVPIRCPAGDCARSGRATARFSGGESRARAQVASGPWRPPAPVYDPRPADRWMHPLPSIGSSERCRKGLRHRS